MADRKVTQSDSETTQPVAARVLVVDDEDALRRAFVRGLADAGYHMVSANAADAACEQAAKTPPDVAIVDLEMPGGGIEVIRYLKGTRGSDVHVIVLTSSDDDKDRAAAFAAGADDYLVKPASIAELQRRIGAALRTLSDIVSARLEREAIERRLVYGQEATALLAHDLNNGLAIALSNISFAVTEVSVPTEVTEALASALQATRRMAGLVANFVDIARFEDAAVKPAAQRVRVQPLLQSVVEINATSRAMVRFVIDCADELEAIFDVGLVERVLHNLVGNALRYCRRDGTITLGCKRWQEADGSVEIAIANTGPQVPEAIRPNLFGKYVRSTTGKRGMGLYFCSLVANAHGGSIAYEARDDGPCFVLRLPGRS